MYLIALNPKPIKHGDNLFHLAAKVLNVFAALCAMDRRFDHLTRFLGNLADDVVGLRKPTHSLFGLNLGFKNQSPEAGR